MDDQDELTRLARAINAAFAALSTSRRVYGPLPRVPCEVRPRGEGWDSVGVYLLDVRVLLLPECWRQYLPVRLTRLEAATVTDVAPIVSRLKTLWLHVCPVCGRPFLGPRHYRLCGDRDCDQARTALQTRAGNRRVAQRRAERRRVICPACRACGNPLTPSRSTARYCSGACRQRAHRQRRDGDDEKANLK
jgi:hypothetical protein